MFLAAGIDIFPVDDIVEVYSYISAAHLSSIQADGLKAFPVKFGNESLIVGSIERIAKPFLSHFWQLWFRPWLLTFITNHVCRVFLKHFLILN